MAPYIYAKLLSQGVEISWGKHVFLEVDKALISLDQNRMKGEGALPLLEEFFLIFNAMKKDNVQNSSVVVDKNFAIIQGAEQVAINLIFNKNVVCEQLDEAIVLPASDMQSFLKEKGVDEDILDAMAFEYCKVHGKTHCVVIWPKGIKYRGLAKEILAQYGQIIYSKTFTLKHEGPRIILKHIHDKAPHVVYHYPYYFNNVSKYEFCAILFQNPKGLDNMTECKQLIRNKIGLGNWVMHADDNNTHSIQTAKMVFSNNSIKFMNQASLKNFPNFQKLYKRYIRWIQHNQIQKDRFCIDHGSVLSIYGIRDCGDLDFVHDRCDHLLKKDESHPFLVMEKDLNEHNKLYSNICPLSVEDVLYNPKNHFYYFGHKVLALPVLIDIKRKLNRPKDHTDLRLIEAHLKKYN